MTTQFHKLLLSELRMVVYQPGDTAGLSDQLLCEAVTLNENLQSLGFVLKPEDLISLAVSPSLHTFFEDVRALVPDVKAQPMYPGFPQQVMEISEAEFRMHQMMHYFSTYGVELLLGISVSRGWLPRYDGSARIKEDTTLMEARVIQLVPEQDAALTALSILLARRERLTNPELAMVVECARGCTVPQMQGLKVRFKENLDLLFPLLLEEPDRETALRALRCICAHTGDVLRCTAAYLSRKRHHLRTGEKRLLVKLLESYPLWNFRQNLMQSLQLRERNLVILQHLDYNQYSRSPEHREAVRALRNGELLSWHGIGEQLLKAQDPKALQHFAQRPGYMLRMLSRLLSLGYSAGAIEALLLPRAGAISAHLIVQTINTLSRDPDDSHRRELEACQQQFWEEELSLNPWTMEQSYISSRNTCIWNCQNQLDQLYSDSKWRSARQKCIREASARRRALDEELERRRDSARRMADAMIRPYREALSRNKTQVQAMVGEVFRRWPYLRAVADCIRSAQGESGDNTDLTLAAYLPEHFRKLAGIGNEAALPEEQQRLELKRQQEISDRWLREQMEQIRLTHEARRAKECAAIDLWEQENLARIDREHQEARQNISARRSTLLDERDAQLAQLEADYRRQLAEADGKRSSLAARKEAALEQLKQTHLQQLKARQFVPGTLEILKHLLAEHFRQVSTPLKGKKVFCRLDTFDLKHSALETGSRSKDGGYIRSGIAFRIPEKARFVRFFIYWNDHQRVDIDLHAGGTRLDGRHLHVGWNSDFRNSGVIYSGDITHSNAAEYIDIDLDAPIREISANVHLFGGKQGFREVQTCYVGMMAVDQMGQEVKLYSPKNCFFTHTLTQDIRSMFYGFVDVQNRCVRFVGQLNSSSWDSRPRLDDTFSLQDYLDCVLEAQQVQPVDRAEDADLVLSMGKTLEDNGVSLVDHNFFLEC